MDYSFFATAFTDDELPMPQWGIIGEWINTNVPSDKHYEAWDAAAETWLKRLKLHLGADYVIDADEEFGLLSTLSAVDGTAVLRHAISTKRQLQEYLRELPEPNFLGPHVIIVFKTRDQFFDYVAHAFPDGEFGSPEGICIRATGYMHIVLVPLPVDRIQPAIAHELTHVMLAHLPIPLWLEEGLAQLLEEHVTGQHHFRIDHESALRHRTFWKEHGLQDFWNGWAYHRPDDGRELAYGLSQVLLRNLMADHPKKFFRIIEDALVEDAGDAAFRKHIGIGIAECAAQFLGQGSWEPDFKKLREESRPNKEEDVTGQTD